MGTIYERCLNTQSKARQSSVNHDAGHADRIEGAAYLMNATSSEDSFADLSSRKVTGSSACRYVAKRARPRSGLEKERV
ncbi:MAG: hypothetical protein Q9215_001479 [Flavoplaca cf. flavocitrina]